MGQTNQGGGMGGMGANYNAGSQPNMLSSTPTMSNMMAQNVQGPSLTGLGPTQNMIGGSNMIGGNPPIGSPMGAGLPNRMPPNIQQFLQSLFQNMRPTLGQTIAQGQTPPTAVGMGTGQGAGAIGQGTASATGDPQNTAASTTPGPANPNLGSMYTGYQAPIGAYGHSIGADQRHPAYPPIGWQRNIPDPNSPFKL